MPEPDGAAQATGDRPVPQRDLGPYPFRQAGGIVDDNPGIGFALENQTPAVYAKEFFTGPDTPDDDLVVVHELAPSGPVTVWRWPAGATSG